MQPEKIDLTHTSISEEKLTQLRDLLPEVFHEGTINWDELRNALGDYVEDDPHNERFGLRWPGKSKLQQLINTPSVGTLVPQPEVSVDWYTTGNVIIEGDNLEVLKLLQKSYAGKIKMIYIDPPYNTGNDFVYPDKYDRGLDTYLEYTGQVDEDGRKTATNSESSGRYHANWLNMMYPRLYLARNLLREDGFVAISIDDTELSNLRHLMDTVFGPDCFRNILVVRRYDKNLSNQFLDAGLPTLAVGVEHVVVYSRSSEGVLSPVFRETDEQRSMIGYWKGFHNAADRPTMRYEILGATIRDGQWKWSQELAREAAENYKTYTENPEDMTLEEYWIATGRTKRFLRRREGGQGKNLGVEHWIPPSSGTLRTSNWTDLLASRVIPDITLEFSSPKNPGMLREVTSMLGAEDSLILDFFAGSGTTGHAVMQQNAEDGGNRKFILVQLPEPMEKKVLDDGTELNTIADICRERVRRAGRKIKAELPPSHGGGGGIRRYTNQFPLGIAAGPSTCRSDTRYRLPRLQTRTQQFHTLGWIG